MSAPAVAALPHEEFLGHPKGLYVCFFTEMWERFSFYGMKALLLLYLVKYHLFTDEHGYNLIGAYGGLVYAMPVIGGLLADRWLGMRKAVVFGGILLVLGHLGMAIEGHPASRIDGEVVRDAAALQVFYFSLALIIMGVGFLKPNISTIVGKLYGDNDPRRDAGFSLFYAGINLGATVSGLLCGWLGETWGWGWGFGAAGIGMLAGLANFLGGQKHLRGHAEPPDPARLRQRRLGPLTREHLIYLGALAGIVVVWGLIQSHSVLVPLIPGLLEASPVLLAMHAVSACLLGGIGWFMFRHCTRIEREQMFAVLAFIGLIGAFNIIASLTLMMIEKREDMRTLGGMGVTSGFIRRVFFTEGMLIVVVGTVAGLLFGLGLCFLQIRTGLIRLEGSVVESYPVKVMWGDLLLIFVAVMAIGTLAAGVPLRSLSKRYLGASA